MHDTSCRTNFKVVKKIKIKINIFKSKKLNNI